MNFSNISFSYPSRPNVPVLRGLSLRVPPKATVALVGPSGCGKSTLLNLLMRSYDANEGTVVSRLSSSGSTLTLLEDVLNSSSVL